MDEDRHRVNSQLKEERIDRLHSLLLVLSLPVTSGPLPLINYLPFMRLGNTFVLRVAFVTVATDAVKWMTTSPDRSAKLQLRTRLHSFSPKPSHKADSGPFARLLWWLDTRRILYSYRVSPFVIHHLE